MGMLTCLAAFEAKRNIYIICIHSARQLVFTHFYTEQRQRTVNADEGKPALDEQQELNSIFECSSSEIYANAAQVSITREILPCTCTIRMHVHNESARAQ